MAGKAAKLGQEGTREQLEFDWKYQLAAERAVELVGEASSRLPQDLRERHEQVPWREIIGMRNRLVHGYDAVDYDIVWDVLTNYAPALLENIPATIESESRPR